MRKLTPLLAFSLCFAAPALAQTEAARCTGDKVTVLPFFPVATSPGVARAEEQRVREELLKLGTYCVQSRAETLTKQAQASPLACDDAQCRRRLAERVDADWIIFAMVYGFGGKTTLGVQAWDKSGERLSRRTFEATVPNVGPVMIGAARALPLAGLPGEASVRGRAVPLALGGVAVIALAAGAAFGAASAETARGLSQPQTGCGGNGTAYLDCLNTRTELGRRQATTANVLYGAAALVGTSAGVLWVMEWP